MLRVTDYKYGEVTINEEKIEYIRLSNREDFYNAGYFQRHCGPIVERVGQSSDDVCVEYGTYIMMDSKFFIIKESQETINSKILNIEKRRQKVYLDKEDE